MVKDFGSGFVTRLGCLVVGLKIYPSTGWDIGNLNTIFKNLLWLFGLLRLLDKLNSRW